jgi:hypothetical protein
MAGGTLAKLAKTIAETMVPFQNCFRQRRPVSKMAAITKNRNFFKWPKLLYFKPESAQI